MPDTPHRRPATCADAYRCRRSSPSESCLLVTACCAPAPGRWGLADGGCQNTMKLHRYTMQEGKSNATARKCSEVPGEAEFRRAGHGQPERPTAGHAGLVHAGWRGNSNGHVAGAGEAPQPGGQPLRGDRRCGQGQSLSIRADSRRGPPGLCQRRARHRPALDALPGPAVQIPADRFPTKAGESSHASHRILRHGNEVGMPMTATYGMLMDGQQIPAQREETIEIRNPANTDEIVSIVPKGTPEDVGRAGTSAQKAFETTWRPRLPKSRRRGRVLRQLGAL